jgi:hypothetical protein
MNPITKTERERLMLQDFGDAIMLVADNAQMSEGGDRAYFGSTNDLDLLRSLRQKWFEYQYLRSKEQAE